MDASDLEIKNCIYQYKTDTALYLRIHNLLALKIFLYRENFTLLLLIVGTKQYSTFY